MAIRFTCPKCQKKYALQDHLGGSVVECSCGQRLQLPKPKPATNPLPAGTSAASAGIQAGNEPGLNPTSASLVSGPPAPRQSVPLAEPESIPLAPLPPRPSAPAPASPPQPHPPAFQSAGVSRKSGLSSGAILGMVAIGAVVLIGGALLLFGLGDGSATDADLAQNAEEPFEDGTEVLDNPGAANDANPTDDLGASPTVASVARQEAFAPVGRTEAFGPFAFQVPDGISDPIPSSSRPSPDGELSRGWVGVNVAAGERWLLVAILSNPSPRGSLSFTAAVMQERLLQEAKFGDFSPLGKSIFRHTDLAVARSTFTATMNTVPIYGVIYHTTANGQSLTILATVSADPNSEQGRVLDLVGSTIALADGSDTNPTPNFPPLVASQPPISPPTQQPSMPAGPSQPSPPSPTSDPNSLGQFRFEPPKMLDFAGSRSIDGDVLFRLWSKNSTSSRATFWGVFTKRGTYSGDTFPTKVNALATQAAGMLRVRNPKVGAALPVSVGQIGGLEYFKQTFKGIFDFNGGSAQLNGFVIASFVEDRAVVVVGGTPEPAGQSTYNLLYEAAQSIEYRSDLTADETEDGGESPPPVINVDPRYAALLLSEQEFDGFALRIPQGMQPSDVKLPLGQTWSWQAPAENGKCYLVVNVSDSGERVSAREELTPALLSREFGPGTIRHLQNFSNIAQQRGIAFNRAIYTIRSDGDPRTGAFFYYSGVHGTKRLIVAGLAPGVPANNPFYLLLESAARTAYPLP